MNTMNRLGEFRSARDTHAGSKNIAKNIIFKFAGLYLQWKFSSKDSELWAYSGQTECWESSIKARLFELIITILLK